MAPLSRIFNNKQINKAKAGFTLIELMVAIAIIAILATIGAVVFTNAQKGARDSKRVADMNTMKQALLQFQSTYGYFPNAIDPGAGDWIGRWSNLGSCLTVGTSCKTAGDSITNFSKVLAETVIDPAQGANGSADNQLYYYANMSAWGGNYVILRAKLENIGNTALNNELDGDWTTSGDNRCNDPWYCVKVTY